MEPWLDTKGTILVLFLSSPHILVQSLSLFEVALERTKSMSISLSLSPSRSIPILSHGRIGKLVTADLEETGRSPKPKLLLPALLVQPLGNNLSMRISGLLILISTLPCPTEPCRFNAIGVMLIGLFMMFMFILLRSFMARLLTFVPIFIIFIGSMLISNSFDMMPSKSVSILSKASSSSKGSLLLLLLFLLLLPVPSLCPGEGFRDETSLMLLLLIELPVVCASLG
mmetsp:Transcript_14280/g.30260  ORF Transcript_14280/g.30260 Transcript_14280/m.30260 type:complete len:227 (+) Transcript_14280:546-1226(+)